jgi:hypothetical protein
MSFEVMAKAYLDAADGDTLIPPALRKRCLVSIRDGEVTRETCMWAEELYAANFQ